MSSLEHLQNGRYALLKKLGEGGKGIVYKARDTVLNRVVAIKILKGEVSSNEAYSRFMREAQVVAKLNHPNIVSIYDIGKEDEQQFFVLEFVDGMSLRALMGTYPEGKCDIQTILRTGIDVCGALQYAHSQGVLHRDIKPENILITEEGTAKLMDFGLAKMLGQTSITQEGMIVGTVAYVAPEIALGKGSDARSDLYSFGAVLYETVTGRPPFQGEDPVKVIFSHIHDYPVSPIRLNPRVPQALAECIMKLLEKEPGKRYQSAQDLLTVLKDIAESFLREVLVPSHKPTVAVPSPRPVAAREIQLIDRVEEMSLLREAVDRAVRGEGGLVFLCGEAGIGKTRLTRELRAYARLRGMQVLYGRCPALFRMDGIPPYVLWSEVLRDYLETCTPEQLYRVVGFYPAEVAKLVPELKQKLAEIPQSLPISPERERDRLFEAVSQFITNISKESPLLVVLDDLQWTDQTSLLLMQYLARGIYKTPLLLLGAYRETDVDERHALSPVLIELNRERLFQSVRLERMSLNDIAEMIKQILEQDDVPKEFCELVYEKTRGNPFFAEEVIKSLKEEKVIYREENKWKIKEVSRIEFPKTVKSVIKTRIGRLDDECQNVLMMASFIGNDATCGALCEVTGIEEDKMIEIIDKILKTGLLKHRVIRGEDVCSFADIIVRDLVYEEVNPFKRKKLHRVVGQALEKAYAGKIEEHFGELASHFLEGGDKDKALDYFSKAGEKAAKVYANSEAASYFQSALWLLEEREGELHEREHVLERLGDIENLIGKYEACTKHWDEALLVSTKLQERQKTAALHRKIANILWDKIGDTKKSKEHHEAALQILEAEPESVELARLYEDIAHMLRRKGEAANAPAWAEKALALAEKLYAAEVVAIACIELSADRMVLGDPKKAREYADRALKIALDNNYMETALRAYDNLLGMIQWGECEKCLEYNEKGLALAKKVGDISAQAEFLAGLVTKNACIGEYSKAVALREEVLELRKKGGQLTFIPYDLLSLGSAYLMLGEWEKSEQYFNEAAKAAQGKDEIFVNVFNLCCFGELHFYRGEYGKARGYFEEAVRLWEKNTGGRINYLWGGFLAWTYIELDEVEKAKNLLDRQQKLILEIGEKRVYTRYQVLRAMLLRAQKKYGESIELFEETLREWESIKANVWSAYWFARWLLFEYARAYLERNQQGDREKALNLLNRALEMFQKMDAKKDIEKIIAKKKLLTA